MKELCHTLIFNSASVKVRKIPFMEPTSLNYLGTKGKFSKTEYKFPFLELSWVNFTNGVKTTSSQVELSLKLKKLTTDMICLRCDTVSRERDTVTLLAESVTLSRVKYPRSQTSPHTAWSSLPN